MRSRKGREGLGGGKDGRTESLAWLPPCPATLGTILPHMDPGRVFPSSREQPEYLDCVWGSLTVQTGVHVRMTPCMGNALIYLWVMPTVPRIMPERS